ncbi:MAG: hypothetical protein N5P05_002404 [Chroococcopsis gigantea SAG 12.99]|jgi:DNA-3-methyladenine glycosylase II|nr:DNA-3-methyladenine glycosylase 2 family protein [Chlorogloea purpurea SAG 13.99]MDV3000798.1 hypothetical protein [Chroococcopsis gigantea SAG 12.99]
MTKPYYWEKALDHLAHDRVLYKLISSYPDEHLTNYQNPFLTLVRAIVGQQISIKAADAIWKRLAEKTGDISAESLSRLTEDEMRSCGLSRQKISYIGSLILAFKTGSLTPDKWCNMEDSEVRHQLIAIRGIGKWTADMFLIFHLHRPDVFPLTDIGLVNAIKLHYGKYMTRDDMLKLAQPWRPYRTVATWYLWRSLDGTIVQY